MSDKRGRNGFWRFLEKLHNPPSWVAAIVIASTLFVCPFVVFTVSFGFWRPMHAAVACILCAILLVYTAVVVVNSILKVRRKVLVVADRYEFTRNLRENYEFRTLFFAVCSCLCNLAYTVFLIVMAFRYHSVWYGTVGVYYILLTFARGGVLLQNRKTEKKYRYDYYKLQTEKVGTYRYCGIMLLVLALSLTFSVVELMIDSSGFRHARWLIYVFAPVAAYKAVIAVVHFVHATKRDDLVVRSVRYINLAVTLMSALCLQTAILAASEWSAVTVTLLNGITGGGVCLLTLALGIYMVVFSVKVKGRVLARSAELAEETEENTVGYNRSDYFEEYNK